MGTENQKHEPLSNTFNMGIKSMIATLRGNSGKSHKVQNQIFLAEASIGVSLHCLEVRAFG
jgi:hypothetical protein